MAQDIESDYARLPEPKAPALPHERKPRKSRKAPHDWLAGPHNPTRGETALWTAVITQAMQDALTRSGNAEAMYHKHEATHWLTGNSRDFITVCQFAGLDPDYIRRMAKRTLANPGRWRTEAGKGTRYLERKEYRKRLKATKKAVPTEETDPPATILPFPGMTG